MMSRWRETLCGSAIKSQSVEASLPVNTSVSEVLSCGGSFLPHASAAGGFGSKKVWMTVFLPKEEYEVVVDDAEARWVRYGEYLNRNSDEVELIENALNRLETKASK